MDEQLLLSIALDQKEFDNSIEGIDKKIRQFVKKNKKSLNMDFDFRKNKQQYEAFIDSLTKVVTAHIKKISNENTKAYEKQKKTVKDLEDFASKLRKEGLAEEKEIIAKKTEFTKRSIKEEESSKKQSKIQEKKDIESLQSFADSLKKEELSNEKEFIKQKTNLTNQNIKEEKNKLKAEENLKKTVNNKILALEHKLATETRKIHRKGLKEQIKVLKEGTIATEQEYQKRLRHIDKITKETTEKQRKMSRSIAGVFSEDTGTTFGHKLATTAQYATAGAGIYTLTRAMNELVKESMAYDDALYNNMAVLNANRKEAEALADTSRDLAIAYGGNIKEIDDLVLTLGRAGVSTKNLADASKSAVELAKITGDSFGDASKVMSTFITAFMENGKELEGGVEALGDKLAYMANESKLSVEDLGTLSNYALSTASSLNLTVDAVGSLATTFSNLGMNASTIGTQIRKLDVIFKSSKGNVNDFWIEIGEDQKTYLDAIRKGGNEGNKALSDFVTKLSKIEQDVFTNSTRNMEILEKQLLENLRNGADIYIKHLSGIENALDSTIQAQIKSMGATTSMERAWNSLITTFDGAVSSMMDIALPRKQVESLAESHKKLNGEIGDLKVELSKLSEGTIEYDRINTILVDKIKELNSVEVELKDNLSEVETAFDSVGDRAESFASTMAVGGALYAGIYGIIGLINLIGKESDKSLGKVNALNKALLALARNPYALAIGLAGIALTATTSKEEKHIKTLEDRLKAQENAVNSLKKLSNAEDAHIQAKIRAYEKEIAKTKELIEIRDKADKPKKSKDKETEKVKVTDIKTEKSVKLLEDIDRINNKIINGEEQKIVSLMRQQDYLQELENQAYNNWQNETSSNTRRQELEEKYLELKKQRLGLDYKIVQENEKLEAEFDKAYEASEREHRKEFARRVELSQLKEEEKRLTDELNNKEWSKQDILKSQIKTLENQKLLSIDNNDAKKKDIEILKTELELRKSIVDEQKKLIDLETSKQDLGTREREFALTQPEFSDGYLGSVAKAENKVLGAETEVSQTELEIENIQRKLELSNTIEEKQNLMLELKEKELELDKEMFELSNTKVDAFYDPMLEQMDRIPKSGNDVIDTLSDVAKIYAKNSKRNEKFAVAEQKTEEKLLELKNEGKEGTKEYADLEDALDKTKAQKREAEIGGYADLAGAMSQAFAEGSKGAIAFQAIQATLGIVNGFTAISGAWASAPFPANIPAVVATTAQMLPIIGTLTSLGGSGGASGGGASAPSSFETARANIENTYNPVIDRLDKQIEILEAIELNGSANLLKLKSSDLEFQKDLGISSQNVLEDSMLRFYDNLKVMYQDDFRTIITSITDFEKELGYTVSTIATSVSGAMSEAVLGEIDADKIAKLTIDPTKFKSVSDIMEFMVYLGEEGLYSVLGASALDARSDSYQSYVNGFNAATTEVINTISDYAIAVIDISKDLKDSSDDFKEIFDDITGTTTYATKELEDAYADIERIKGDKSFSSYIQSQIEAIDSLYAEFDKDTIDLILSSNLEDATAQIEKIEGLSIKIKEAFDGGIEEAQNFAESIELVAEAMATSTNNIQDFYKSFLTDEQLLNQQANKLGLIIPKTMEDLVTQFDKLANDTLGLTDEELEYLESAKDYMQDINDEILADLENSLNQVESIMSSLSSTIDKLRGSSATSEQTLQKFYDSLTNTKLLFEGTDYEAINKSVQETSSLVGTLLDTKNFTSAEAMAFTQLRTANELQDLNIEASKTQEDLLGEIATNTAETVDVLLLQLQNLGGNIEDAIAKLNKPVDSTSYISDLYNQYGLTQYQDGSTAGIDYWANQIDTGSMSASDVTSSLASASNTVSAVQDIYDKYDLNQYQNDSSGYVYWTQQVESGNIAPEDLEESIKTAAEASGLVKFADGGIVTAPTVGLIGEAGYNEAVIPLKDPNDPLQMNTVTNELKALRAENVQMKNIMIKLVSNSERQLSTQRGLLDSSMKIEQGAY